MNTRKFCSAALYIPASVGMFLFVQKEDCKVQYQFYTLSRSKYYKNTTESYKIYKTTECKFWAWNAHSVCVGWLRVACLGHCCSIGTQVCSFWDMFSNDCIIYQVEQGQMSMLSEAKCINVYKWQEYSWHLFCLQSLSMCLFCLHLSMSLDGSDYMLFSDIEFSPCSSLIVCFVFSANFLLFHPLFMAGG